MNNELIEKEKIAIQRFKAFEPEDGYVLCYSGGKDSDCIKIMAQLAGVKFEAVHSKTSVDAPETMKYIKSQSDVRIETPRYKDGTPITMWNLIVKHKMPPTRMQRYCCKKLKETTGAGRVAVTGVRWAESAKRRANRGLVDLQNKPKTTQKIAEEMDANYRINKRGGVVLNDDNDNNRRMVEQCYRTNKTMLNPIVDWTDNDVWDFLHYYGCESNPLYQCGEKRIGCIGCPMQGSKGMLKDFERYPKYKQIYLDTFDRMIKKTEADGKPYFEWKTAQDVFDWWTREPPKKNAASKQEEKRNEEAAEVDDAMQDTDDDTDA